MKQAAGGALIVRMAVKNPRQLHHHARSPERRLAVADRGGLRTETHGNANKYPLTLRHALSQCSRDGDGKVAGL
jgi:hypothetical protein